MRIDELHVKNFRGFEERSFRFHPRFNVLIGENGSGKTAVLRAARIAMASWFLGIKNQNAVGIRKGDVRVVGRAFEAGEFTFEKQWPVSVAAEGTFKSSATTYNSDEQTRIRWNRELRGPKGKTTYAGAREIKELANEADQRVRDGDEVTLPVLAYYSTERLALNVRRTKKRKSIPDRDDLSRFVGYRDAVDKRLDSKALEAWMHRQGFAAWEEGAPSTLYRVVRQAIASMIEDATDIRYDPKQGRAVVLFKDQQAYALDNLSDGQKTMMTLVGDLATRMVRLNPHLGADALRQTPGVVLIDELDLHLHPKWQRRIANDLTRTFPNIQFITTTHSPQIISEIDEGNVYLLREDGETEEVHAYGHDASWILRHVMGSTVHPEEIQELLGNAVSALSEARYEDAQSYVEQARELQERTGAIPADDVAELTAEIGSWKMMSEMEDKDSDS